ncbi:MAG TPA: heavy-metal-associated domain-containing protein [Solirubrobacterales bacterium]|nr:heavy-metal-associated domain-containing protein [Solirubrobacterales bacterium]
MSSRLTLRVPDMSCGHCVTAVSDALGEVTGVDEVRVDLEGKEVVVEGEGLDPAPLARAIRDAGYEPEES